MNERRIVLTGFMGAGKTTLARALAASLHRQWQDLDDVIAMQTGRLVPDIIRLDGEARFRELETKSLRDSLENGTAHILALGGGAWTLERNRLLVQQYNCLSVWLDAPFALCWQRITPGGDGRPLAHGGYAATNSLYESRAPLYAQAELRLAVSAETSICQLVESVRDVHSVGSV